MHPWLLEFYTLPEADTTDRSRLMAMSSALTAALALSVCWREKTCTCKYSRPTSSWSTALGPQPSG
jgi:hypothetical protein